MCSNGEVRRATSRHTAQPPAPITTVADSRYTLVPLTHSAYTDSLLALNRTHPHPLTSIETPPTHSHAHTLPPSPTPTISTLQDPTSRERDAIVAEFYGALNTAASPSDLNDLQKEWANTAASLNLSDELLSEIQGVCTAWWCSLVLPSPIRAFRVASVCMLELEDTAPFALTPSLSLSLSPPTRDTIDTYGSLRCIRSVCPSSWGSMGRTDHRKLPRLEESRKTGESRGTVATAGWGRSPDPVPNPGPRQCPNSSIHWPGQAARSVDSGTKLSMSTSTSAPMGKRFPQSVAHPMRMQTRSHRGGAGRHHHRRRRRRTAAALDRLWAERGNGDPPPSRWQSK